MPPDHDAHQKWLGGVIEHVDSTPKDLHPVLKEFQGLIETNPRVYMLIEGMFLEIPRTRRYGKDPTGQPQIRDYKHMLQILNHLITNAPSWSDKSHRVGLVGLPINAVFDWSMGTPSGYAAFLDPHINKILKKMLDAWGEYLKSPESAAVLDNSSTGWFGDDGQKDLTAVANHARGTSHKFEELFVCEPNKPHHGFKSWDDFFTRLFRDGARPVAEHDNDNVIANACESSPYKLAHNVNAHDKFWIKSQPYSILHMLANDDLAPQFVGGTVYQAFLSALSYHRWHSPVSGKIVKAYVVPGTYYSEPLFEGPGDPNRRGNSIDMSGETEAQGYITAVATRGLIFIQADNPAIGLMAFIGVGMAEVSTCELTAKEGDHVRKGDQIGMFHFGGSTHCLCFRQGVKVDGFPKVGKEENVPVRSKLAVVHS